MGLRLFVLLTAGALVLGTVSGKLPEGELGYEVHSRTGTIRRLRGRELLEALLRRARWRWALRQAVVLAVVVVVARLAADECTDTPVVICVCMSREVVLKGVQVTETDEETVVCYPGQVKLVLSKSEAYYGQMVDVEMVRLLHLRDEGGKKVFTQAEVGKLFGLSRQMTNRRKRLVEQTGDLTPLVRREYEKGVLTDEALKRIAEIVSEDWWKSDPEIAEQLVEERVVGKISSGTVNVGLSRLDARLLRAAIRERIEKGEGSGEASDRYLVRRLFKLVEDLLDGSSPPDTQQYLRLKEFEEKTRPEPQPRGPYRRDVPRERRHTLRNRRRKLKLLRKAIEDGWDMHKERPLHCPDCLESDVRFRQSRPRTYQNGGGESEEVSARQYRCLNPACTTNTFTRLPNELESWARASFFLKRKAFGLVFHVRGSLRRSADFISFDTQRPGPSWTSVLNWIRKAGQEAIPIEFVLPIRWSGHLGLDEKWVKRYEDWVYIYEAMDVKTGLPILKRVFPDCNQDNARAVLLEIKSRGYLPKVIVTDLTSNYDKPIKDLFPEATSQKCLFHAEMAARKLVRKYLPEEGDKKTKEQLLVLLRSLFAAETTSALESQLKQFLWAREHFPSHAAPVFDMVERNAPHLRQPRVNPEIPTTNNATENLIKEFDILYRTTFGYSSIPALQDFLDAYTVYQQFRKYSSGPHKGLCPLEVAGHDLGDLDWDFYLLAG